MFYDLILFYIIKVIHLPGKNSNSTEGVGELGSINCHKTRYIYIPVYLQIRPFI